MDAFTDKVHADVDAGKLDGPLLLQAVLKWHRDKLWRSFRYHNNGQSKYATDERGGVTMSALRTKRTFAWSNPTQRLGQVSCYRPMPVDARNPRGSCEHARQPWPETYAVSGFLGAEWRVYKYELALRQVTLFLTKLKQGFCLQCFQMIGFDGFEELAKRHFGFLYLTGFRLQTQDGAIDDEELVANAVFSKRDPVRLHSRVEVVKCGLAAPYCFQRMPGRAFTSAPDMQRAAKENKAIQLLKKRAKGDGQLFQ